MRNESGKIANIVQEYINNIMNIILSKSKHFFLHKYCKAQRDLAKDEIILENFVNINGGIGAIFTGIITIVIYGYGGYKVINGYLTIGNLVAIQQYTWMLLGPSVSLLKANSKLQQCLVSAKRVYDFIELPDKMFSWKYHFKDDIVCLEFKDCNFKYEKEYILSGLSFQVKRGESIAIVGRSGIGKSTIIKLLFRLWDLDSGSIIINNQFNLSLCCISDIRKKISIVNQDFFIFDDSIYNNLTLGRKIETDIIWDVLDVVGLKDCIIDLPEGLNCIVGEKGIKFSGGQRQRMAIARALLEKSDILILDEATSALDIITQNELFKKMKKYLYNKILIIIAHRYSAMKGVDQILVLENGKVRDMNDLDQMLFTD